MSDRHDHFVHLPDSDRVSLRGAQALDSVPPDQPMTVTVYVRRDPDAPPVPDIAQLAMTPPKERQAISDESILNAHRAKQEDLDAVSEFGRAHCTGLGTPDGQKLLHELHSL